jgi:quinol monooxygenase YgiN
VPSKEADMGSSMVRYKVRPDRVEENEALVRAVYEQLAVEQPGGLHYATFKLPDGVSFMHVVFESDQPGRILNEVAAFRAFASTVEDRCEEPPAVTEITLVGSYRMGT